MVPSKPFVQTMALERSRRPCLIWGSILGSGLVCAVIVWASHSVAFSFRDPVLLLIATAVFAVPLLMRRIPVTLWLWWGFGAMTLAWSLAPGESHVTTLWEITYLAAFAAAWWRPAFWIAAGWIVSNGVFDMLALNAFATPDFRSGSIHYVSGAKALVLVPLLLALAARSKVTWQRIVYGVLGGVALYASLISGARAVYLPLVLVAPILIARLAREGGSWRRVLVTGALASLTVLGLELIQPYRPLATALSLNATLADQTASIGERGGVTQRFRFWHQTLDIAIHNPLGAGNGSYQSIINSYQKYPMVWSASPHNYFVETAATGGWPRLALLIFMLLVTIWRAWHSREWPWALAVASIWLTLAFDVTSYYPSFMMFAFLALGACSHASEGRNPVTRQSAGGWRLALGSPMTIAAAGLSLWWFLPCEGNTCFTSRYHGPEFLAGHYLSQMTDSERTSSFATLRELNPQSIWVLRREQQYAESPAQRAAIAQEIATRFPLQTPFNYLDWADAALDNDDPEGARTAIERGLEIFGPDTYPYGEFRMTRETYSDWLDKASQILRGLSSQ